MFRLFVPPKTSLLLLGFATALFDGFAITSLHCAHSAHAALRAVLDEQASVIRIQRGSHPVPILTQQIPPSHRPFIHPLVAPDGKGILTEAKPPHHPHQTGLYWGFTRINGRDTFHHPEGDYWKRQSATILPANDEQVRWQTVYDILAEDGTSLLTETQTWTMSERDGEYFLDLQWQARAHVDLTIGKYDYGGLFLRMPWREGIAGEVVNAARQRNQRAEGQRAIWTDVGMQIDGRDDWAHVAIFDHPQNRGFPQAWRVDGQLGIGPVPTRGGDWHIPADQTATIKHQIVVYTGTLNDLHLTNLWQEYTGQSGTYAMWNLAQQEGRQSQFLTAEESVQAMTVANGFRANAYASEPMITQPMAFCWDDRGRLWIAENRDYETRGTGFANAKDSRILILEDTDHDGRADKRTVFLEGIHFPAAIAVGMGGLWLGAPPHLLFIPDRDNDDRADWNDIEVRLTGWGIRDRHETLNSLLWGPDGWLYGCQGFATPSQVGTPAGDGKYNPVEQFPESFAFADKPVDIDGGIWRYHPHKRRFEVVAHGFSNPWGLDYDPYGQMFISACVIPHLWHVIPGGIYHRQGGSHFNPYVYDDIKTIADHRHRSAHGGARVYASDAFPEQYRGRIFMANIHEHAVLTDTLEPHGSGFVGHHGDEFLLANNAQWIGFSVEIGPEGGLYVLDWHDADICGKEVLQRETGRIYRVVPENSLAKPFNGRYDDLNSFDNAALVTLQTSDSDWHARRARVVMQHRAAQGTFDADSAAELRSLWRQSSHVPHRLRALWSAHVTGTLTADDLVTLLDDPQPYVRAWAIQLLCEDSPVAADGLSQIIRLSQHETSPVVRLYLAAAMQRLPDDACWQIASQLAKHAEDADDHNIPKMIWYGIQPHVTEDIPQGITLATSGRIPLLTRFIARRLADDDQLEPVVAWIAKNSQAHDAQLQWLTAGLLDSLDSRQTHQPPSAWDVAYPLLKSKSERVARLATELAQRFGDTSAIDQLFDVIANPQLPAKERESGLQVLATQRGERLQPQLPKLLDDDAIRTEVIRTIAAFDNDRLASALLERYASLTTEEKLEALQTLASRTSYGQQLTESLRQGRIPRTDVPAYVARQLQRVVGPSFVDVWGSVDLLAEDQKELFAKYRDLLTDANLRQADPGKGHEVFLRTCAVCHRINDEGGQLGPDLTGANRTNVNYLLDNILTPSATIQDAYRMLIVNTNEGRVYSGILSGESDRSITLRIANREMPVVIARSEILSQDIAPVSMMPEGILNNLSEKEVLNLVAFLRSTPAH
ncbi:MAG: DUF6807 family protein [Pirellulaceae bacterium]